MIHFFVGMPLIVAAVSTKLRSNCDILLRLPGGLPRRLMSSGCSRSRGFTMGLSLDYFCCI